MILTLIHYVLNLIINGLPSILNDVVINLDVFGRFKPYYKWITFNTKKLELMGLLFVVF